MHPNSYFTHFYDLMYDFSRDRYFLKIGSSYIRHGNYT